MKNINHSYCLWGTLVFLAGAIMGCSSSRTPEAENLLKNLKTTSSRGIMFGHQDDTVYGIGWEGESGKSDVKSVCGEYPAVISFDLGHLELGDSLNLDGVAFDKIRQEIINQYERGGMISLSWHVRNPATGGDSWDVSDSTVVKSILPSGNNHVLFAKWLNMVADFMNSLQAPTGEKIPVLFRPWHEHTGSWFWWGAALCSPEEYKALWKMTIDALKDKGVNHLLYAYSPGSEPQSVAEYMERYPGDSIIDLVGLDTYQSDKGEYLKNLEKGLAIIDSVGKQHDKAIALTETGYEGIPDSLWWTQTLLPAIEKYPLSYVLVWRNARERITHHYAPYPGHPSAVDFVDFYQNSKTLFVSQLTSLYK